MPLCDDDAVKLDYLNNHLAEHDRVRVEDHIASCERCRQELVDLGELAETLGRVPVFGAPPEFVRLAEAAMESCGRPSAHSQQRRYHWRKVYGAAVGAVVFAAAGLVVAARMLSNASLIQGLVADHFALSWGEPGFLVVQYGTLAMAGLCLPSLIESLFMLAVTRGIAKTS